ncbi:MAG: FtsX-like permease family protein, partial [Candidatus Thorarchaeota archaeon]
LAFKNIIHHKRHMGIIIFGFTISMTMLLSVYYWSGTSEDLALNDFLQTQDYQSYIYNNDDLGDLEDIEEYLRNEPLVDEFNTSYATAALFNTEGKSIFYECLPEDDQENTTNPVSITNAFLAPKRILERIRFLFNVDGVFSLENNSILISLDQAKELSTIYGKEIAIGDTLNLSIARYLPNPAYGQNKISDFNSLYYENFTISGIYTIREGISILQEAIRLDWLADSILFPSEAVSYGDKYEMVDKGIPYIVFVKFNEEVISVEGIGTVIDKMNLFSENIKANFPSVYVYVLSGPIASLQNAYSRATITIVFMIPVILIGIILTIFMVNIVVQSRQSEIALLRDRGADAIQILLMFIVEFVMVSLIGIIVGIVFAYFVAALIPSFTSSGFSTVIFGKFLANMKMFPLFTIGVSLGFLLILVGYASFKIWWDVARKGRDTVNQDESRKKFEKNIILGINIGAASVVIIALIFSLLDTIRQVRSSSNFSIASTASAGYTFILFSALLIFGAQITSFLITDKFLTKIKGFYKRLIFNDAFFLINNFRRKDKKLSTMTFALVIVSSVIVFSLISTNSVNTNQIAENNYKMGADLRIITYPLDASFTTNVSRFEGVNEVVPIYKTQGEIAYNKYTIYGISPVKFSRIGYWDKSSFVGNESYEIFQRLEQNTEGVIIGVDMAERLNLTVGNQLPVSSIPGGRYLKLFDIVGIVKSAPGLGLADGTNIEMLQPNDGFILINSKYLTEETTAKQCQLFMASVLPDYNPQDIAMQIKEAFPGIEINPQLINEEFMGAFIESYIPNVLAFFWIELVVTAIIGIVLVIMFTDFTLSQRTHEFAITVSMGFSRGKTTRLITFEILTIMISAALSGILVGILFTYSVFFLMIPLLTAHNIIPFVVSIPIWQIAVFPLILTFIAMIGILPSVRKYSRQDIIKALRA